MTLTYWMNKTLSPFDDFTRVTRLIAECTSLFVRFGIPCIMYSSYAFNNPDLELNNGNHCFVSRDFKEPLVECVVGAQDVTKSMLSFFNQSFYYTAIALLIGVVWAFIRFCYASKVTRPLRNLKL